MFKTFYKLQEAFLATDKQPDIPFFVILCYLSSNLLFPPTGEKINRMITKSVHCFFSIYGCAAKC